MTKPAVLLFDSYSPISHRTPRSSMHTKLHTCATQNSQWRLHDRSVSRNRWQRTHYTSPQHICTPHSLTFRCMRAVTRMWRRFAVCHATDRDDECDGACLRRNNQQREQQQTQRKQKYKHNESSTSDSNAYKRLVARKSVFSHVGHVHLIGSFVHSVRSHIQRVEKHKKLFIFRLILNLKRIFSIGSHWISFVCHSQRISKFARIVLWTQKGRKSKRVLYGSCEVHKSDAGKKQLRRTDTKTIKT